MVLTDSMFVIASTDLAVESFNYNAAHGGQKKVHSLPTMCLKVGRSSSMLRYIAQLMIYVISSVSAFTTLSATAL